MLPLMLAGYLFLLIFRPFEYWPILGALRLERVYMLAFMTAVFLSKDKRLVPSAINTFVVSFVLVLFASAAIGMSWPDSWGVIQDYLKYVIFYFMVILSVRDEEDFRLVLVSFVTVMALYVGKSAWEFFFHGRYVWRMGIRRMVGIDITFGSPNSFAASICYSLPLTWALIRAGFESKWLRWGLWGYGGLALMAIILSGSRSGMVTFLLFLFLLVMGTSRKMLGIVLAGLLLVVSWDYMPEDLQMRFLSTFSSEYATTEGAATSAEGRSAGFRHGLSLFAENPLLGIGPGNFRFSWPGITSGHDAHNVYGQLLGELGFLGLLSFGGLLWLVYRRNAEVVAAFRRSLQRPQSRNRPDSDKPQTNHAVSPVLNSHGGSVERSSHRDKPRKNNAASANLGTQGAPVGKSKWPMLGLSSPLALQSYVSQAIVQTMLLMLFKGWADHNLYRYTWLWLAALTVLNVYFFRQEMKRHGSL